MSIHDEHLRAWIYARVSKDKNERASVTDQETAGRSIIAAEGWELAGVSKDNDRGASRYSRGDRPGWDEVRAALGRGEFGVLILWETSRGDRKLSQWAAFLDACRDRGVLIHVISHGRTYDLKNARDYRSLAEDGVDNAYETDRHSGRVKRGINGARLRGQPHGMTPYGYRRDYHPKTGKFVTLRIEPAEAEVVREIIRRIGHYEPVKTIARDLEERGVPGPAGGGWDPSTMRYLAKNPLYTGHLRLADGSLKDGDWPAIITVADWNAAVVVLAGRGGTRPGKQRHLLTGLGECHHCGGGLVARMRRGNPEYSCKKGCFYCPQEWLNEWVSEVICARLARPDARDLFRSDDKRSAELQIKLTELERRHEEFAVRAARGKLSATALERIEEELLPEIEAVRRERDALSLPPALREILTAPDVRKAWAGMDIRAQRAIIAAVTGIKVSKANSRSERTSTDRVTFTQQPVQRAARSGRRKS